MIIKSQTKQPFNWIYYSHYVSLSDSLSPAGSHLQMTPLNSQPIKIKNYQDINSHIKQSICRAFEDDENEMLLLVEWWNEWEFPSIHSILWFVNHKNTILTLFRSCRRARAPLSCSNGVVFSRKDVKKLSFFKGNHWISINWMDNVPSFAPCPILRYPQLISEIDNLSYPRNWIFNLMEEKPMTDGWTLMRRWGQIVYII